MNLNYEKIMSEYKIEKKRIIFSADFKPSIQFFKTQYDIIDELQSEIPNWEIGGANFVMSDRVNNYSGVFLSKKVTFEFDAASDKITLAKEKISKILAIYHKHLPIDSFLRLGMRFFMFISMGDIKKEELSDIITPKLFVKNEFVDSAFSENITDIVYTIDYSKDDYLYHFKCGPMPKEQIPAWVDFGQYKHRFENEKVFKEYLESFPEMSIFLDYDCYANDVTFDGLDVFLNRAVQDCSDSSTKIKKYLLGEKK